MDLYGIIGNPLGHSFSKKYFTEKFENQKISAEFVNFPIPTIEELPELLNAHPNLKGICVTIPYKEKVFPFLNQIDPLAQRIGAVNSIRIENRNGQPHLTGYNTDIYGFMQSLKSFIGTEVKNALILGTGGASKAIALGLETMNIDYHFVSRKASKPGYLTYDELTKEIIGEHQLIVNCSPLGTFPNVDQCPNIPYQHLTSQHYLYDLVYNPEKTLFLKNGAQNGAHTHNGLKMLHLQAEKSWEIWNEK